MKWIKFIWTYITAIIVMVRRIVRDYVIPIIHFIQAIKLLLESESEKIPDNIKKHFADQLFMTEKFITQLITAFVFVIKQLLPDEVAELEHKTNLAIIKMYIAKLKTLDDRLRNMLLFKTASLMLIWFMSDHDHPVTETEADFLTQTAFTYLKHKGKLKQLTK